MDRQIKVVIVVLIINFLLVPFISNYYAYYLPKTHDFVIQEEGISNGSQWGINVEEYQGGNLLVKQIGKYYSTGGEITLTLPYGYYQYAAISPQGYKSSTSGADFHLSSSTVPSHNTLIFLRLYSLYFNETGLSSPEKWAVKLNTANGPVSYETGQSSIEFSEPFGTYGYSISQVSGNSTGATEYAELPSTVFKTGFSYVNVTGYPSTVHVDFTPTAYRVEINISADFQVNTGNIDGIGVQIDGRTVYSQFNFSALAYNPISVLLANGTYQYSTSNVTGYSITNGWGYLSVDGMPANETIYYKYHTQSLS